MSSTRAAGMVLLSVVFVLPGVTAATQDLLAYSVDTGTDIVTFVAQPELGHVVKFSGGVSARPLANAGPPGGEDKDKEYLNVTGRPEILVILGREPLSENERNIKTLSEQSDTEYASPLFLLGGQTIAVIPEIIVRLDHETDRDRLEDLCWAVDCTIVRNLLYTQREFLISTAARNAEDVLAIVEALSSADFVEWAWPNIAFQPQLCNQSAGDDPESIEPNDPYYPKQWHLEAIHAPEAWAYTTGDPNIVVAVLDDGVDVNHPDLKNNIWVNPIEAAGDADVDDDGNGLVDDVHGWDFVDDDSTVDPVGSDDAHGTACAGLIAAQGENNIGVRGVAWNCTIMPVRISRSFPKYYATADKHADTLRYTAAQGADVISNSWDFPDDGPIHSAIRDITRSGGIGRNGKGCIVLFSSGNEKEVEYPAKYPEVIAVGAIRKADDVVWGYSGCGPELDIVAPSGFVNLLGKENLWTTDITGKDGYNNWDPDILDYTDKMGGTSGACPIAAGVAALVLSIDPDLTTVGVRRILLRSARDLGDPGWDEEYGFGCVDANAAVTALLDSQGPLFSALFVDDDAGHGFEDGSEQHPFHSIQEAIDQSFHGDIVIVKPGTYTGEGNRGIRFDGKTITVRSQEGPETCTIDCQELRCGFSLLRAGVNSVVEGFTITNGTGAIGGGIWNFSGSPTIVNCTFAGNSATCGAGISNSSGSPTIVNCTFTGNSAGDGGGIYNSSGSPTIVNCTFTGNSASKGGGIYNSRQCASNLTNCIVWNNASEQILWNDASDQISGRAIISYSNIQGGWDGEGEGNIDIDPLFADVDNGDYHLKSEAGRWDPSSQSWVQDPNTSPCIDTGDPNTPVGDELLPNGGRINMGTYGGTTQASKSTQGN